MLNSTNQEVIRRHAIKVITPSVISALWDGRKIMVRRGLPLPDVLRALGIVVDFLRAVFDVAM